MDRAGRKARNGGDMATGARPRSAGRRLLTRADVARLLEVSPATVARWSREGKLPFVRTLGGQRRYLRERIAELVPDAGPAPAPADADTRRPA